MTVVQDESQGTPKVLNRSMVTPTAAGGTREVGVDWGLGTKCDDALTVVAPANGLSVLEYVLDPDSESGGKYEQHGRVDLPMQLEDAWLVAADYIGDVFLVESDLGAKQPGKVLRYSPQEYGRWLSTWLSAKEKAGEKPVVLLARQQNLPKAALTAVGEGLRAGSKSASAPNLYAPSVPVTIRNPADTALELGADPAEKVSAFALLRAQGSSDEVFWWHVPAEGDGLPQKTDAPLEPVIDPARADSLANLSQAGARQAVGPARREDTTDAFLAALNVPEDGETESTESPEDPGLVLGTVDGLDGWVRQAGAVPDWAELEVLAGQVKGWLAQQAGDVSTSVDHVVDGSTVWGREAAPRVQLAALWQRVLAGGVARSGSVDGVTEVGGSGVRALLGGRSSWVRVDSADHVERLLVGERDSAEQGNAAGLYATVVWEPTTPGGNDRGTVWHAHQVDGEVRWMALDEADPDAWWLGEGGPARFAAGHARAMLVSADGQQIDVYGRAGSAGIDARRETEVPPGVGWLDPGSQGYRAALASLFHAGVAAESSVLHVPADRMPSREEQRDLYAAKYPAGGNYQDVLDVRAQKVARAYVGAKVRGGGKQSHGSLLGKPTGGQSSTSSGQGEASGLGTDITSVAARAVDIVKLSGQRVQYYEADGTSKIFNSRKDFIEEYDAGGRILLKYLAGGKYNIYAEDGTYGHYSHTGKLMERYRTGDDSILVKYGATGKVSRFALYAADGTVEKYGKWSESDPNMRQGADGSYHIRLAGGGLIVHNADGSSERYGAENELRAEYGTNGRLHKEYWEDGQPRATYWANGSLREAYGEGGELLAQYPEESPTAGDVAGGSEASDAAVRAIVLADGRSKHYAADGSSKVYFRSGAVEEEFAADGRLLVKYVNNRKRWYNLYAEDGTYVHYSNRNEAQAKYREEDDAFLEKYGLSGRVSRFALYAADGTAEKYGKWAASDQNMQQRADGSYHVHLAGGGLIVHNADGTSEKYAADDTLRAQYGTNGRLHKEYTEGGILRAEYWASGSLHAEYGEGGGLIAEYREGAKDSPSVGGVANARSDADYESDGGFAPDGMATGSNAAGALAPDFQDDTLSRLVSTEGGGRGVDKGKGKEVAGFGSGSGQVTNDPAEYEAGDWTPRDPGEYEAYNRPAGGVDDGGWAANDSAGMAVVSQGSEYPAGAPTGGRLSSTSHGAGSASRPSAEALTARHTDILPGGRVRYREVDGSSTVVESGGVVIERYGSDGRPLMKRAKRGAEYRYADDGTYGHYGRTGLLKARYRTDDNRLLERYMQDARRVNQFALYEADGTRVVYGRWNAAGTALVPLGDGLYGARSADGGFIVHKADGTSEKYAADGTFLLWGMDGTLVARYGTNGNFLPQVAAGGENEASDNSVLVERVAEGRIEDYRAAGSSGVLNEQGSAGSMGTPSAYPAEYVARDWTPWDPEAYGTYSSPAREAFGGGWAANDSEENEVGGWVPWVPEEYAAYNSLTSSTADGGRAANDPAGTQMASPAAEHPAGAEGSAESVGGSSARAAEHEAGGWPSWDPEEYGVYNSPAGGVAGDWLDQDDELRGGLYPNGTVTVVSRTQLAGDGYRVEMSNGDLVTYEFPDRSTVRRPDGSYTRYVGGQAVGPEDLPLGSRWLDPEAGVLYEAELASLFHAGVAAELSVLHVPADRMPSREEQRDLYAVKYPAGGNYQDVLDVRAQKVARAYVGVKVRGGGKHSHRSSQSKPTGGQSSTSRGLGEASGSGTGASRSLAARAVRIEEFSGRRRVEEAMARSVTAMEPIKADGLRTFAKRVLPGERGEALVDRVLSDEAVKAGFSRALGEWPAASEDGIEITVRVKSLSAPRETVEQRMDAVSASAVEETTASSKNTQTSDPVNPTKLLSLDTGYVKVKPRVEGMGNTTSSTVSATRSRSNSTTYTRPNALNDVGEHTAVFEVTVRKPAESHLGIPGVHHAPVVETHEVALPVKLAWPRLDVGADAETRGLNLSYPKTQSGTDDADQRAAAYAESSKQLASVIGVKVVARELHETVKGLVGDGHDAEVAEWLDSLAQLDERPAQKLVGGESIEKTFGSGDSARTVRIFERVPDGASDLISKLVDSSRQTTKTHTHDQDEFSEAESRTRTWGGELSVESGSAFAAGSVGVELSSKHSHTDLRESATRISRDVTDQRTGEVRTHEVQADLVVHMEGGRGKQTDRVVRNARLEVQMRERSVSPPPGQRTGTPSGMRAAEAPDSVHAVYKIDESTAKKFIGPVLKKLATGITGSENTSVAHLAAEKLHGVSQDLEKLILDNARDVFDGDGDFYGDGLPYVLPDGLGTLIVRGEMDRAAGTYQKPLAERERDEVLMTRAKQALTRSSAVGEKASATGGASAGVASLTGELGYSRDRTASDGYTVSSQEQQIWHSSSTWHQFQFPIGLAAGLERDGAVQAVFSQDVAAGAHLFVKVSVPERPGVGLPGDSGRVDEADSAAIEETDWEPKLADSSHPQAVALPVRSELETLKPVRNLRWAAAHTLVQAADTVTGGPHNAEKAARQMARDSGLADWAGSTSRLAEFSKAAGPEQLADRIALQRDFKGRTHLHDHHARGEVKLRTELTNPRVVDRDDEHPIKRIQGVSTELSSHRETVHGVEADLTAAPSDPASMLGLLSASAEAKVGYHRGKADRVGQSTVEQTTQTHKGRAYLVVYDARHTVSGQVTFDSKHGADTSPVELTKDVPDAVQLWVEAADIHDVGLPDDQLAKLAEQSRPGTALDVPAEAGEDLGMLEPHRSGALSELMSHVDSELTKWASSALADKAPELVGQFAELRQSVVRQLGERARSGGYASMMDDARNGGLALAVTDQHAEGGKRELLVVLRTKLGGGRYFDSLDELSTTTSYTSADDHQAEISGTLSAEASAGLKGSSDTFGALGRAAAPALAAQIDDLGDRAEDLLDKLPDALSSAADSAVDAAKDKLDDKIGDKLGPAFQAEASRRTALRQGGGDKSTVTMTRTGPAHRFVYDQRLALEVHPWAHDGFYKNAAKSLAHRSDDRRDVVKGVWHSAERVTPSAVRLTLHEEDYVAAGEIAGREAGSGGSARMRGQDSWAGLPDGAFADVLSFPARGLHQRLSELVDSGVHVDEADEVVNSFRASNLLTGTSATQLRRHFREQVGPSGYRVEVNSKSLRAVTIKVDLHGLVAVKALRSSSADQTVSHPTVDQKKSSVRGAASLALSDDGPKVEYEREHEGDHDAPRRTVSESDTGPELYLVRGAVATSVTPEYREGHQPPGTATGEQPTDKYRHDGYIWLAADRTGLAALGVEPLVENVPEVTVESASTSPTTRSAQSSTPGSPAVTARQLASEPGASGGEGDHAATPGTTPRQTGATVVMPSGVGWLDSGSGEYNAGLASTFHATVALELQRMRWPAEVPSREQQWDLYVQVFPKGLDHIGELDSQAKQVAQKYAGAATLGGKSGIEAEYAYPMILPTLPAEDIEGDGPLLAVGPNGAQVVAETRDFNLDSEGRLHRIWLSDRDVDSDIEVTMVIPEFKPGLMRNLSGESSRHNSMDSGLAVQARFEEALAARVAGEPGTAPSTPLEVVLRAEDGWQIMPLGEGASIGPRPIGEFSGSHVQHNIGVQAAVIQPFLEHVLGQTWQTADRGYYTHGLLSDALSFADGIAARFIARKVLGGVPEDLGHVSRIVGDVPDLSVQQLRGHLALLYEHAAGRAVAVMDLSELDKENVAALMRPKKIATQLMQLPEIARDYLADDHDYVVEAFAARFLGQFPDFRARVAETWHTPESEAPELLQVSTYEDDSLQDFLYSGLIPEYSPSVDTDDMFGAMQTIELDTDGGRVLPLTVLEVRAYDQPQVSARRAQADHARLVELARGLYAKAERLHNPTEQDTQRLEAIYDKLRSKYDKGARKGSGAHHSSRSSSGSGSQAEASGMRDERPPAVAARVARRLLSDNRAAARRGSADEQRLFRAVSERSGSALRRLTEAQVTALVLAERLGPEANRAAGATLNQIVREGRWPWLASYQSMPFGQLVDQVVRFLRERTGVTINIDLDEQVDGVRKLDLLTSSSIAFRNAWEMARDDAEYLGDRGEAETLLGYGDVVERSLAALQSGTASTAALGELPKYAALMSAERPGGLGSYGDAVFHLRPEVRQRSTFTPMDSFGLAEGRWPATGPDHLLPLLAYGDEKIVRLAFAEATRFEFDLEYRDLRDGGGLAEVVEGEYFEVQVHGDVRWADVEQVVLDNYPADYELAMANKTALDEFAAQRGYSFTVEVINPPLDTDPRESAGDGEEQADLSDSAMDSAVSPAYLPQPSQEGSPGPTWSASLGTTEQEQSSGANTYDMSAMQEALPSSDVSTESGVTSRALVADDAPTVYADDGSYTRYWPDNSASYYTAAGVPVADYAEDGRLTAEYRDGTLAVEYASDGGYVVHADDGTSTYYPPEEGNGRSWASRGRGGRRWVASDGLGAPFGRVANDLAMSAVVPRRAVDPVGADEIAGLVAGSSARQVELTTEDLLEVFPGGREVPPAVVKSYEQAGREVAGLVEGRARAGLRYGKSVTRFDHRVLSASGGRRVQYFGRTVHLAPLDAAAAEQRADYESAVLAEFHETVTQDYVNAQGDQLYFAMRFTDDPAEADQVAQLTSEPLEFTTPDLLSTSTPPRTAVHETVWHGFGLRDETVEPPTRQADGALTQPVGRRSAIYSPVYTDNSVMARPAGDTAGLPGTELKERHIETLTANALNATAPQPEPTDTNTNIGTDTDTAEDAARVAVQAEQAASADRAAGDAAVEETTAADSEQASVSADSADLAKVLFSADAEFNLSDTAVEQFAGRLVAQLSGHKSWGGGPMRTLIVPGQSQAVSGRLKEFILRNAADLALRREVPFALSGGSTLVLRGSVDPDSGQYTKQLDEPERADVIAALEEMHGDSEAQPGGTAAQDLWQQQKSWKEQAKWQRYSFPIGLKALLKPSGEGEPLPVAETDGEQPIHMVTVSVPDPRDMTAQHAAAQTVEGDEAELPCLPVPDTAPTLAVPLDTRVPGLEALYAQISVLDDLPYGPGGPVRTPKGLGRFTSRLTSRGGKQAQVGQGADPVASGAETEVVAAIANSFRAQAAQQQEQGLTWEEVRLMLRVTGSGVEDLIAGYSIGGLLAKELNHRITVRTPDGGQIDVCP